MSLPSVAGLHSIRQGVHTYLQGEALREWVSPGRGPRGQGTRSPFWVLGRDQAGSPAHAPSPPFPSFVVGSDGYVYEGRGWRWVGAHTRGHNSRGFGVAIIGNYSARLPTEGALRAVRQELPQCAVRAGLLRADYKLLGHRQLVTTTECPGEVLFQHLRSWPHFSGDSPSPAYPLQAAG